jgi:hypothetical protein
MIHAGWPIDIDWPRRSVSLGICGYRVAISRDGMTKRPVGSIRSTSTVNMCSSLIICLVQGPCPALTSTVRYNILNGRWTFAVQNNLQWVIMQTTTMPNQHGNGFSRHPFILRCGHSPPTHLGLSDRLNTRLSLLHPKSRGRPTHATRYYERSGH